MAHSRSIKLYSTNTKFIISYYLKTTITGTKISNISMNIFNSNSKDFSNFKNIAILGGSKFIGLNLLLSLHKRGHKITLYNRNITIPSIKYPDDIILIVGDRNNSSDYKKLFIKSAFTLLHYLNKVLF